MALKIYFDPLDLACKSITGAIKQEEKVRFNLFLLNDKQDNVYSSCNFEKFDIEKEKCVQPDFDAILHLNLDGENAQTHVMTKTAFGWTISLSIKEIGLYYYVFAIDGVGFVSCNDMIKGEITARPRGFQLTVYAKDYKTPEWFKGGVMYQIFPDRFAKKGIMPHINGRISRNDWGGVPSFRPNEHGKVLNNDFFGGNFKGIEEKLPYLKSLGVSIIYLNPIFEATSNHRYDTADYMKIDPFLGTEEDFKNLIESAQKHGISIVLDGVFNHTGDNSVYFNKYGKYPTLGAYQSKNSPYYSWYTFQEFPDKYESWWGIDILPEINEKSNEYQKFIFDEGGVLKKWLTFGIGGYRLDVADELPDFFLQKLRKSVKESNPNAIIIGEVWEDASNKVAYSKRRAYLHGYELDSVMNYPLKDAIISYIQSENATVLLRAIRTLNDHYPKQTVDCLMNILGTHDTARILTVLGGIYCQNKEEMSKPSAYLSAERKEKAIEKLKMAVILQFTLPGVPCIYYGDENGQEGHIDPFCRRCYNWDNQNQALITFYQKLGAIRENYKDVFKDGEFYDVITQDGLFVYKRKKNTTSIYVYTNNSSKNYILNLPNPVKDVLTDENFEKELIIQPNSFGIFIEE